MHQRKIIFYLKNKKNKVALKQSATSSVQHIKGQSDHGDSCDNGLDNFTEIVPLSMVETCFNEQNSILELEIMPNPHQTSNNTSSKSDDKIFRVCYFAVQKILLNEFGNDSNQSAIKASSEHYEDKSIFYLQMIHYLQDSSLLSLLSEEARDMLGNLENPGSNVVFQLFKEKEAWYRKDQLQKLVSNINSSTNIDYVFQSLVGFGFLEKGDVTNLSTLDEYLDNVLNYGGVMQLCASFKLKESSKKNGIAKLKKFAYSRNRLHNSLFGKRENNYSHVLNTVRKQAGDCYRLSKTARNVIYRVYTLTYIGILYDYIKGEKLEHVPENLQMGNPNTIFKDYEEFEQYLAALEMRKEFLSNKDKTNQCEIVLNAFKLYKELSGDQKQRCASLSTWLKIHTPAYVYVEIMIKGVAILKKSQQTTLFEVAVDILTTLIQQDLYCKEKRVQWCDEKALILHKYLNRPVEAAKELINGFEMDVPAIYKVQLRSRAITLQKLTTIVPSLRNSLASYDVDGVDVLMGKSKTIADNIRPVAKLYKGKTKYVINNKDSTMQEVGVEEYARKWYAKKAYNKGGHWEGRIIITIFYLLFWDIIYKPIRNVGIYMNVLQKDPLDLYTQDFYTNRKEDIVNRLYFIRKTNMQNVIHEMKLVWDAQLSVSKHSGISRDIGWYNCEQVALCLGQHGLLVVCERLATDFKYCQSGFPDLTLFDVGNKRVKFVEVKSVNDKPTMKQKQWVHYLNKNKIDAEFCNVGTKTTAAKSRRPRPSGQSSILKHCIKK